MGVSVPPPEELTTSPQGTLPGVSDHLFEPVRAAVRGLSTVARYIEDDSVNEAIRKDFPDPALLDTVPVAASRLAPRHDEEFIVSRCMFRRKKMAGHQN